MAQKLSAPMPSDLDLPASWVIQIAAVDPSSGANVSGVKVSNLAVVATPIVPDTEGGGISLVPVNPVWLPDELSDQ